MLFKQAEPLLGAGEEPDSERIAEISDVRVEKRTVPVFNIEVANAHTFFVGDAGVLVHNGRTTPGQRNTARTENQNFNGGKCEWCGAPMTKPEAGKRKPNDVNVDHMQEQRFGGDNKPTNLRCLCATCNQVTRNGRLFNTMK